MTSDLDVDWLAVDRDGHFAIFLGTDASSAAKTPPRADRGATSAVIERIAQVTSARMEASRSRDDLTGYRDAAVRPGETVFDAPLAAPGTSLHEEPFTGYRHLFTADVTDGSKASTLREIMEANAGREVVVRDRFAMTGDFSDEVHANIHARSLCSGCLVMEDPADPRPRSIEVLAASGLYVYRFGGGFWIRAASPAVPVSIDALESIAEQPIEPARLSICFEETLTTQFA